MFVVVIAWCMLFSVQLGLRLGLPGAVRFNHVHGRRSNLCGIVRYILRQVTHIAYKTTSINVL